MIRVLMAQEQAQRTQPGATVEVVGYDDDTTLKLLALRVSDKTRLEFRNIDKLQHRELYEFMHQDPNRPSPVLIMPVSAGRPGDRAGDKWLR
jgi:hypothetical protein